MNAVVRGLLATVLFLQMPSCTGLRYVAQGAAGQDDLNRRARDIDDLVREKRVGPRLRRLLAQVAAIKSFGELHGLRPTPNYTKYVRLDRPAVVWAVSASEPLRFHSKSWSFPLVGSFVFLNWFKQSDANAFAKDLAREGWDVNVRGVGAYSTAGFFEDAIVSSMIPEGKQALGYFANVILHESLHATVLVKHQSTLNESLANFVGDHLAAVYLQETLGREAEETTAYLDAERSGEERGRTMQAAYQSLEQVYASKISDAEKLAKKRDIIASLAARLHATKPITNATLIQYKTYNSGQTELLALFNACEGDWPRFVLAMKSLESATFPRHQETDIGAMIAKVVVPPRASAPR